MILIIDDDIAVRSSLSLLFKQAGYQAKSAAGPQEALAMIKETVPELIIQDMNFSLETSGEEGLALLKELKEIIPQTPVILITAWASITLAVEGVKAGAIDFIGKPWNNEHVIQSVQTALSLSKEKSKTNRQVLTRKKLDSQYNFEKIIGEDPQLLAVLETVGRVSTTDASILIEGESGTGKELIAEAIHVNSPRKHKPFVKVNLGGISSSLFESEMFGHKRGAFTDAKSDRVGRFEMANKGSIFLDEIGELDLNSQVKLLRVLQDRTFEVLGDSRSKSVDIRVVCATNRNLGQMVGENKFREDLFYRINLITVKLPPLRERPSDIPLLVNHFMSNLQKVYGRQHLEVSPEALQWLKQLPLPGNIRELKNLVERTVLVSANDILTVNDFMKQWQESPKKTGKEVFPAVGTMTLDEMEATMIRKTMDFYEQNVSKVAKALGLSRGALYRRLDKYGIPYDATE